MLENWVPNHNMGTKKRCRREKMAPEASTSDSEAQIQEARLQKWENGANMASRGGCANRGGGETPHGQRFRAAVEGGYRREVN